MKLKKQNKTYFGRFRQTNNIFSEEYIDIFRWNDGKLTLVLGDTRIVLDEKELTEGISRLPKNDLTKLAKESLKCEAQ